MNRKVFLNFFAFLILLIFFSSLVFSATYTKKISDGTLTHNFDFNGRIAKRWSDNNAWVPSPAVDWNVAYHTYEGGRQLTRDNNLAGVWDSNLLVLWDMNDNASGTMLDSTGNGRSGTQNGITSVSGRWGTRGYGFNAGSSYVEADAKVSAFAGLSQGTISVWLKTTVNSATEMTFFSIGSTSITFGDFMVYSRGIRYRLYQGGTLIDYYSSNKGVTDGNWHHVVFAVDTAGTRVYIDGIRDMGTYAGGSATTNSFFDDVVGENYVRLGHSMWNGGTQAYKFAGELDSLAIWGRGLTETEIKSLYAAQKYQKFDQNLLAYLKMDNYFTYVMRNQTGGIGFSMGNALGDSTIYDVNNYVIRNNAGLGDSNTIGYTSGSWTPMGPKYVNDLNMTTAWTLSGWVNPSYTAASTGYYGLISKGHHADTNINYSVGVYYNALNDIYPYTRYKTNGITVQCVPTGNKIPKGYWHQLVSRYNGSTLDLFMDGKKICSADGTATTPTAMTTKALIVGYDQSYLTDNDSIDEVKIYNRALSDAEISLDYNYFEQSRFVNLINFYDASLTSRRWDYISVNNDSNFIFNKELSSREKFFDRNLQAVWHLNNNFLDSSGNGYDLNTGNTNSFEGDENTTGLWDTNAFTIGSSDTLQTKTRPFGLFGIPSLTVSAWVNPTSISTYQGIYGTGNPGMYFLFDTYGIYLYINGGIACNASGRVPEIGKWSHLVGVFANGQQTAYLNGKIVCRGAAAWAPSVTSSPIYVGSYGGASAGPLLGKLDEVAVWNRALSKEEVRDLYIKGSSKLDLNVYTCTDINCVNKTASYYISDINNGTSYALSSLPVTSYLGFDAFFKNSNWWGDYNYGTNWATSFVQDVSIEAVAGNTTPILTLTDFNGNNPDGTLGNFKGVRDLDFNVSDAENERLTLNVYISNSTAQDTSGDHIITDLNLTTTYCSSETWTSDVNCHVDVNTLLASDGSTKYIKVIVTDGTFTAYDFTSSLGVDNTKPIVSWTGVSSDWVRSGTSVTLNCTDAVAGCSVKRYRINSGTWNTYSTPLSITTGDGNYLFEVDANDTIGNQADTNSFYVLVGYNGKLRTYNDSNKARSFFGLRERAKIVYDANLIYAPTITITDSNGSTVNYGTMVNISNDGNLGLADYNTYYFNYDLNGAYGWYNVLIQNQYFGNAFFQARSWTDRYTDYNSTNYPFSFDLNLTEPGKGERFFNVVDTNIRFSYKAHPNAVRVLDYNGSAYLEIPSQLHSSTFSGSLVTDANLVFLTSLSRNETKQFFVGYSVVNYDNNALTDLNLNIGARFIDVNTSSYRAILDINNGGTLAGIKSWIGTGHDLNSGILLRGPEVRSSTYYYRYSDSTSPTYSVIDNGSVLKRIRVSNSAGAIDYNIIYSFYPKAKHFTADINSLSKSAIFWNHYISDYLYFDSNRNDKIAVGNGTSVTTYDLNAGDNVLSGSTNVFAGTYDKETLNGFGILFLDKQSSKSISSDLSIYDTASDLYVYRQVLSNKTVSLTDFVQTKTGYTVFNPLLSANDLNEIYTFISNPLTVSKGTILTNDSTVPVALSSGYSPSDANDLVDLNCYASFSDNTLVSRVDINITGPNLRITSSESFLDTNAFVDYNVPSYLLNGGTATCLFTAYDIADNNVSSTVSVSVKDYSAPSIYRIASSPDANASIDPGVDVNIDANIAEYSGLSSVTLYTKYLGADGNWSDWNAITMSKITDISDYNKTYRAKFTTSSDDNTYQYYVNARDVNGNDVNSSTYKIYSFYDWTWTLSTSSLGVDVGALSETITLGTVTVQNTGDMALTFRISSNWENKSQIWYNGDPETASGKSFSLGVGDSNSYIVSLKTKTTERSDSLTITFDAINTSASPDTNTVSGTVVSLSDGPFLLLEWVTTDVAVTQGDTNIVYVIKMTNVGNADANNVVLDWNYPSDWTRFAGTDPTADVNVSTSSYITSILTYDVGASAVAGDYNISVTATCSDANKTQSTYVTVSVSEAGGGDDGGGDDGGDTPNGPGSGGPNGTSSPGGAGGSIFPTEKEKDKFFQTAESFELVRGQQNSFPIKIENTLSGTLKNLKFKVEGLMAKYLKLKNTYAAKLDANKSFYTDIQITSPAYFNPGEYKITFTIDGNFINDKNVGVLFTEKREILLLIHDTNKETAQSLVNEISSFLNELKDRGFKTNEIPYILKDTNKFFREKKYDDIALLYVSAKDTYDKALTADSQINGISGMISYSAQEGIDTPNTDRILALAKIAFQRGEYALALERLKEAELTYSLETKGEFNPVFFVIKNYDKIIIAIIIGIILAGLVFMGLKWMHINSKLDLLNKEGNLLLTIIQDLQKKCFVENKMPINEYYDALSQYEDRMAQVSEGIVEYESKKANIMITSSALKRLLREKLKLLDLIKNTQKDYFDKGLIETRIYETRIKSLTKRLSEVEESSILKEFTKTERINRGILKHFWRVYYRIFK